MFYIILIPIHLPICKKTKIIYNPRTIVCSNLARLSIRTQTVLCQVYIYKPVVYVKSFMSPFFTLLFSLSLLPDEGT